MSLWYRDKRLPYVVLPIKDGDRKRLTGISIEFATEGPKLVVSLEEHGMQNTIGLEMMVYNMVQLNKTEDASVNLDLIKIKSVGFDLGPSLELRK